MSFHSLRRRWRTPLSVAQREQIVRWGFEVSTIVISVAFLKDMVQ